MATFIAAGAVGAFIAATTFVAAGAFIAAAFTLMAVAFVVATATLTVVTWWFVLVEAGAPASAGSDSASPRERATGAEREKPDREKCRQTLLHEKSFGRELLLMMTMAGLVAMLGLVAMASFATMAALAPAGAFAALAFTATGFAVFTATGLAAFAAFAFTAFSGFAFLRLFTGTFVGKMATFAMDTGWRFGFFTRAFVWNARTFAVHARRGFGFFTGAFVWNARTFAVHTRWFVLVEACAARHLAAATGQCESATGAKHEKSNRHQCGEATPHGRSLLSRGARSARGAHRPQLDSIECERVKRGAPVAECVGDLLEVVREAFIVIV